MAYVYGAYKVAKGGYKVAKAYRKCKNKKGIKKALCVKKALRGKKK